MKKIMKSALWLLCGLFLLTACSDDNDANPVIQTPTGFQLNTPALADQYIELTPTNKVNLTWSQPDYGYNALVNYKVQVGLVNDNGTIKWNEENGTPKYLESTFSTCNVNLSGEEVAMAMCQLDGVTSEDDYVDRGFRQVAMRVVASILKEGDTDIPGTVITSNPVVFKHMAAYFAIKTPGYIFVVGNCTGWATPDENSASTYAAWRVNETDIDTKVYVGEFDMPAGDLQFRFYLKLTGWDGGDSWGPQVDDAGVESEFTDGVFEGPGDAGKGTWLFHDFPGGKLKVTVDLVQKKVKFEMQ